MKITLDISVTKKKIYRILSAYVFIIIIDTMYFYSTRDFLYPHLKDSNFNYIAPFVVWFVMALAITSIDARNYNEVFVFSLLLGFVLYSFYNLFTYIVDQSAGIGVIFYDTLYGMILHLVIGTIIWFIFK